VAQDPRQIEREIEVTRSRLDSDVDALADKVSPRNVARRTAEGAKENVMSKIGTARDAVMGTASDLSDTATQAASGARSRVSGLADDAAATASGTMSRAAGTAGEAATAVRRQTGGSPLVAGAIAFGAGWLAASLIPATRAEERVAALAADTVTEHADALRQAGQSAAIDLRDSVTSAAQEAAASVRETARGAARHVAEDARGAAGGITG
jgi:phage-related protein